MKLTGVLLAGGESRRMGRDKAFVEFEGRTLAERAAAVLAGVCDEVVVASGDGERLARLGLEQVADAVPGAGPLGGILAGLDRARTELVAILAVDMPFASAAVLRLLARRCGAHDAAVALTDRGPQPLHAVYAKRAAPALERCLEDGTLAVVEAVHSLDVVRVEEDEWRAADPTGRFAFNLNRPEDLDDTR